MSQNLSFVTVVSFALGCFSLNLQQYQIWFPIVEDNCIGNKFGKWTAETKKGIGCIPCNIFDIEDDAWGTKSAPLKLSSKYTGLPPHNQYRLTFELMFQPSENMNGYEVTNMNCSSKKLKTYLCQGINVQLTSFRYLCYGNHTTDELNFTIEAKNTISGIRRLTLSLSQESSLTNLTSFNKYISEAFPIKSSCLNKETNILKLSKCWKQKTTSASAQCNKEGKYLALNQTNCKKCHEYLYLYGNICVNRCPDDTYFNETDRVCRKFITGATVEEALFTYVQGITEPNSVYNKMVCTGPSPAPENLHQISVRNYFFGGFDIWSNGDCYHVFTLSVHTKLRIYFQLYLIDAWVNGRVRVTADVQELLLIEGYNQNSTINILGGSQPDTVITFDKVIDHSSEKLSFFIMSSTSNSISFLGLTNLLVAIPYTSEFRDEMSAEEVSIISENSSSLPDEGSSGANLGIYYQESVVVSEQSQAITSMSSYSEDVGQFEESIYSEKAQKLYSDQSVTSTTCNIRFCQACYLNGLQCLACAKNYIAQGNKCIQCTDGYYWTADGCQTCVGKCARCQGYPDNCLECQHGYKFIEHTCQDIDHEKVIVSLETVYKQLQVKGIKYTLYLTRTIGILAMIINSDQFLAITLFLSFKQTELVYLEQRIYCSMFFSTKIPHNQTEFNSTTLDVFGNDYTDKINLVPTFPKAQLIGLTPVNLLQIRYPLFSIFLCLLILLLSTRLKPGLQQILQKPLLLLTLIQVEGNFLLLSLSCMICVQHFKEVISLQFEDMVSLPISIVFIISHLIWNIYVVSRIIRYQRQRSEQMKVPDILFYYMRKTNNNGMMNSLLTFINLQKKVVFSIIVLGLNNQPANAIIIMLLIQLVILVYTLTHFAFTNRCYGILEVCNQLLMIMFLGSQIDNAIKNDQDKETVYSFVFSLLMICFDLQKLICSVYCYLKDRRRLAASRSNQTQQVIELNRFEQPTPHIALFPDYPQFWDEDNIMPKIVQPQLQLNTEIRDKLSESHVHALESMFDELQRYNDY